MTLVDLFGPNYSVEAEFLFPFSSLEALGQMPTEIGQMPTEIGLLTNLHAIVIIGTQFTSTIPSELGPSVHGPHSNGIWPIGGTHFSSDSQQLSNSIHTFRTRIVDRIDCSTFQRQWLDRNYSHGTRTTNLHGILWILQH